MTKILNTLKKDNNEKKGKKKFVSVDFPYIVVASKSNGK